MENAQQNSKFKFSDQLDEKSILKYTASNLSFCHKLFKVFLTTIPPSLEALDNSIMNRDFVNIHANAHKIKSNFKIVGLDKITQQLGELEKTSTQQSTESLKIYKSLKPEINSAMSLLSTEAERLHEYLSTQDIN